MRFACCVFLLLFSLTSALAQSMEGGARVAALGGAGTALLGDVWGQVNPAAWATLDGRAVAFFASQGYGLRALRLGALHYVEPTRFGAFSGGARTFGFEAYRETHLNLGYARGFRLGSTRQVFAGLNVRYHQVSLETYGAAGAVGLSLGALAVVFPGITVGFHATNVNLPEYVAGEALPRTLAVGVGYAPEGPFRLMLDVLKDVRFPLSVRGGMEVAPVPTLALRAGIGTEPTRFTAGVGLQVARLHVGVAAERHEALGWSPAAGLHLLW